MFPCVMDDSFVYNIQRLQIFLIHLTILQQQQNYTTHFSSKLPLSIKKEKTEHFKREKSTMTCYTDRIAFW